MSVTEKPSIDLEQGFPCVVRHPDAGGQCERTAEMLVYGLNFCKEHGEEARHPGRLEKPHEEADYHQIIVRAYLDTPEKMRAQIVAWEQDEDPRTGRPPWYFLLESLESVHKLMLLAYKLGETWLVELLEYEREGVAAQAAYAWRDRAED